MRSLALVVVVVVLGACAPAPAERLHTPKRIHHDDDDEQEAPPAVRATAKPRPELEIAAPDLHISINVADPDPSHQIRWPLGLADHPELAPHYDIANVLAEPGLDWIELCKMGAYRRTSPKLRDQLLYLRAWCSANTYDYASAIEALTKLRNTVVPGLALAIRADLSNLLVSHDPDSARELVGKFGLATESDVLDRVAATYADMGRLGGAQEMNELVLANDSGKSPAKTCQRLVRRVLLAPEAYRTSRSAFTTKAPVPGFTDDPTELLFGAKLDADPQCAALDAEVSCWLIKENCAAWYKLHGISEADASLIAASMAWPREGYRSIPDAWWHVVNPALKARPKKEAYAYAVVAAEASLKLTDCDDTYSLNRIRNLRSDLQLDADTPPEWLARIQTLDDNRAKLCFKPY